MLFAADRAHAELLASLVRDTECGFELDPIRPELLVIKSRPLKECKISPLPSLLIWPILTL